MTSSPKVSTSTSHGGGYRRSASATGTCPTRRRRADARTASHVICVCGAARSSIPPRTWPLGSRTHSAVPRLIFRRNVDSKSGIGPNKGSTSRAISSQDATSSCVPRLTPLTRTECPPSGRPGTRADTACPWGTISLPAIACRGALSDETLLVGTVTPGGGRAEEQRPGDQERHVGRVQCVPGDGGTTEINQPVGGQHLRDALEPVREHGQRPEQPAEHVQHEHRADHGGLRD